MTTLWRSYSAIVMVTLAYRRLACGVSLLGTICALSACGGGTSGHDAEGPGATVPSGSVAVSPSDPATGPVSEPNAVVVRVEGHAITRAMFARALAGLVKSEGTNYVAPVPPNFNACIEHLEASSASSATSGSKLGATTLKDQCEQQYQTLEKHALDPLIVDQWVIGGAAEEGVHVSDKELAWALKKAEAGQSQAQAEQELASSGRTLADFALETKVQLLAEGIRHILAHKTAHVTQAQVADYYDAHKSLFGVPKRRDLEIVRANSDVEARKIKSELASGKTFASVVSKLPSAYQPIYSKNGVVLGYEPKLYREPPLDHAIFDAKPNTLSGPVGISLGYYDFKVTRTYPPHQKTLAQSEATIRQQLPSQMYKQALVAFIRSWRVRWIARTDCEAGYVVPKCRQFKPSGTAPPEKEDAYTLN